MPIETYDLNITAVKIANITIASYYVVPENKGRGTTGPESRFIEVEKSLNLIEKFSNSCSYHSVFVFVLYLIFNI